MLQRLRVALRRVRLAREHAVQDIPHKKTDADPTAEVKRGGEQGRKGGRGGKSISENVDEYNISNSTQQECNTCKLMQAVVQFGF